MSGVATLPVTVPLLAVSGLSKTFPGTRALDGVQLSVRPGEVHALLGSNGSGKSTLIKVLTGVEQPDPGATVAVNGKPHALRAGGAAGVRIRCMHQDLGLVDGLSVVDNVGLGDGYATSAVHTLSWSRQRARTRELLGLVGLRGVDIDAPLSKCDQLTKIQIAIARVMGHWGDEPGLLILDEPTASLPAAQSEPLFDLVRDVRAAGNGVLYVTHRLAEVFDLTDSVTVLRHGRVVHTGPSHELDRASLVEHMLGHRVDLAHESGMDPLPAAAKLRLKVRGLRSARLDGLDLEVKAGEIVGIAGVAGSGHDDVPAALIGVLAAEGQAEIDGRHLSINRLTPSSALNKGVAFLPPDRKRQGIIDAFSIRENIGMATIQQFAGRLRWIDECSFTADAETWGERVSLKPLDTSRAMRMLSGGNQQKVVVARCLAARPLVLLLSEPTAGVDVAAREQIWDLIICAARDGLAVIVTSTDTNDLAALCHRVVVLQHGHIHAELQAPNLSQQRIAAAVLESTA